MDIAGRLRDTGRMLKPGSSREQLAGTLGAAFAEGLLSEQTLSHRLGLLFGPRLIEPRRVVGDLSLRGRRRPATLAAVASALSTGHRSMRERFGVEQPGEPAPLVLALDWSGAQQDLVVGRGSACDITLGNVTVSRRHARLVFRDGAWVVHDLASRNGLTLNGAPVGRSRLRPGDRLGFGLQLVDID
ncbi:MAG TPA: FHA domain-containing protein [Solirubrobacteraceae bacterium]|jgi:hypothetical protein|nr:FHA domain-containing protein [Solirubrobacteraceae bacterium]